MIEAKRAKEATNESRWTNLHNTIISGINVGNFSTGYQCRDSSEFVDFSLKLKDLGYTVDEDIDNYLVISWENV